DRVIEELVVEGLHLSQLEQGAVVAEHFVEAGVGDGAVCFEVDSVATGCRRKLLLDHSKRLLARLFGENSLIGNGHPVVVRFPDVARLDAYFPQARHESLGERHAFAQEGTTVDEDGPAELDGSAHPVKSK